MNTFNTAAFDAARALATVAGAELTTNLEFHGASAATDEAWPTVVFDWGVMDFQPMYDDAAFRIETGVQIDLFIYDDATVDSVDVDMLFDHGGEALKLLTRASALIERVRGF